MNTPPTLDNLHARIALLAGLWRQAAASIEGDAAPDEHVARAVANTRRKLADELLALLPDGPLAQAMREASHD